MFFAETEFGETSIHIHALGKEGQIDISGSDARLANVGLRFDHGVSGGGRSHYGNNAVAFFIFFHVHEDAHAFIPQDSAVNYSLGFISLSASCWLATHHLGNWSRTRPAIETAAS